MMKNTTYIARALQRAGRWDLALDVLEPEAVALRAEILTDAFWWRLEGAAEAADAVAALRESEPARAAFLDAQLAYTRTLFGIDARPGDAERARAGFTAAASDRELAPWAAFWLGVVAELLDKDPAAAAEHYRRALAGADGDPLLESYAIRHLGGQALESGDTAGLDGLRRSYHLRAALGARPQTAAAAVTLADRLPDGPEARDLREAARTTARELGLRWLME
jgi:hypothetical protein